MSDKNHQSHTCEYQIRIDGNPKHYASSIGQNEIDLWLNLCAKNPDCYIDIARVNTHIVMCQADYHQMKRHFAK